MSKGTVRFPASAIADGCVGTARIREQIAGAAARLALDEHVPLDAAISRMVDMPRGVKTEISIFRNIETSTNLTPKQRNQALGRLGTGRMNKTEAAYEQHLAARRHVGEVLFYRFEAHKLRLADNTFYTPDFTVIVADGSTEYHEVKGYWTDKARAKTKVAASQHPYRFIAIKRDGRHGWSFEDLTSRSW
ncbi:hypothetical protein [Caballeronia sordidicola]|uniref:Helicase subunit of the DNA excision repair complex n=1 Tax=Caballeronia sordidicola TaxID=196367 RepID=A0A242N722_CABSO|nr:hypothetical protein [Caballeronia sordidicola]OTP79465.1 Helicase subunit of the DNA excision repair complex [Caballeronia sordidicola]